MKLKGNRTYILALMVMVVAFLSYLGIITTDVATFLYAILGAGSMSTIRSAIPKK